MLREVSLEVAAGRGGHPGRRNGAGKSTLLRCVMGLHPGQRGTVAFDGRDISRLPAHKRARLGLGWVPDDRGIYATLTVTENLTLPPGSARPVAAGAGVRGVPPPAPAPALPGTMLSGGEQQMLALARVLRMGAPGCCCDEPTEGLSPAARAAGRRPRLRGQEAGVTVLLVEQNLHFATGVADRHYLLAEGRSWRRWTTPRCARGKRELLAYLGI